MKKTIVLLIPLLFWNFLIYPQDNKNIVKIDREIAVEVVRLSERVLVLTDVSPNGNVTAIATKEGLILIDTGVSWGFGNEFRQIVEQEFKRNDFLYVINTHADRDHTFGNQAFQEALIIGHSRCYETLEKLKLEWNEKRDDYVSLHKDRAEKNTQELMEMIQDSDQAARKRQLIATNNLIASNLSDGQEIVLPSVTFDDRMTLYSGDTTLHLYYLGKGHSDCDLLIHLPQEKLVVAGDAFIKSMLVCYLKEDEFDVERYLEILNSVLMTRSQIKYVVCGHGALMTGDDLLARREYLNSLLKSVKDALAGGLDLKKAICRLPLKNFSRLVRLIGKPPAELREQHAGIVERCWAILSLGRQK